MLPDDMRLSASDLMKFSLLPVLLPGLLFPPLLQAAPEPAVPVGTLRAWVQEMKEQPRGPFSRVRWFCKNGMVLDPEPYACEPFGGGIQHGEWSDRTKRIRAAGYPIGNVLAPLKPEDVVGGSVDPEFLRILLLEKFLIAFDDGWILRKAQFHRGVLQDHNEKDSATAILLAMLGDPVWRQRFVVLREAVRLLPHGAETALLTEVRGQATTLAEKDKTFDVLRNKIHISPDAADAKRVRAHAAGSTARPELQPDYEKLAQYIDEAYTQKALPPMLHSLARRVKNQDLSAQIEGLAASLEQQDTPENQLRLAGDALALIREHLLELGSPSVRLAALDASLNAEITAFTTSRQLLQALPQASRAQRLNWMGLAARAVYGLGLLTRRELDQIERSLAQLRVASVPLPVYREELQLFERVPGWSDRRLAYHFAGAIDRLLPIEPLAAMYVPDRLRSSPMLFYSSVLDSLTEDANRLAGVRHKIFGQTISSGLRRLNPGLARGMLRLLEDQEAAAGDGGASIYLVPETTADLPAAAGILTAEEGNPLSHVQLLARNLGIPNVVVDRTLMGQIDSRRGRPVMVAASVGGVVRIEDEGLNWRARFGGEKPASRVTLKADTVKLDLSRRELIPTAQLSAADSGRIVGPKAAQVAELSRRYPGKVSPGLVIPFGVYRALLDRPMAPGQPSMFSWMKLQYDELQQLEKSDPQAHAVRLKEFLATVRKWILSSSFEKAFIDDLRKSMQATFGSEGSYGVFVRSDTNVEDLPGFTGAGLNKTVPNVVGLDRTLKAIREVWASPFSDRAFSWRQGLMDKPEHVYASVLLHQSVPAGKSGVMITADVDTGSSRFLTVASNLGVGGGVDGQLAETLRIALETGEVRLLGSATARKRRVLIAGGDSQLVAAAAPETLLLPEDIAQLVELARGLPAQYPGMKDEQGNPAPADIEFGFVDGRLMLFQIRPFLQNKSAQGNQYLNQLDAPLRQKNDVNVDLQQAPAAP